MKISVVIPWYNSADYIRRCVDSILGQSLQPSEIICVNDGSTDNTLDILNEYKARFPHFIQIIDQANAGACAARNAGMNASSSEFIQFLDTDDELMQDKLRVQAEILRAQPTLDIIAGNCTRISHTGAEKVEAFTEDEWIGLIRGRLGNTCANLFRKSAVVAAGGWNEKLKSSQEADLMFRMLCIGAKVEADKAFNTVVHARAGDSISSSDTTGNLERFIQLRYDIFQWLRTNDQLNPRREYEIAAIMLGSLRMLYGRKREIAVLLHDRLFKSDFKVRSSVQNSLAYVLLYRIFGFAGVQKILDLTGR